MKIAFCGAHGTGKSSLIEHSYIRKKFKDHDFIYSVSRRFTNPNLEESQHCINIEYVYQHFTFPNFVSARSIFDAWAYSNVAITQGFDTKLHEWACENINYDFLFYLPIEFALVDDGFRPLDAEYQKSVDKEIQKLLWQNSYPYVKLTGSIEDRIVQIKESIDGRKS